MSSQDLPLSPTTSPLFSQLKNPWSCSSHVLSQPKVVFLHSFKSQHKTRPHSSHSWQHPRVPLRFDIQCLECTCFCLYLVTAHPRRHHLAPSLFLCLYSIHCHRETKQNQVELFPSSSRPYSLGIRVHFQLSWPPKVYSNTENQQSQASTEGGFTHQADFILVLHRLLNVYHP